MSGTSDSSDGCKVIVSSGEIISSTCPIGVEVGTNGKRGANNGEVTFHCFWNAVEPSRKMQPLAKSQGARQMVSMIRNLEFVTAYPLRRAKHIVIIHKIHPLGRHYTCWGATVGDGVEAATGAGVGPADITLSSNTLLWMLRVPVA